MKFTYNIQKVDFFIDQVEEMGQVDLDTAIDAFQKFPFADQLKEARQRELTSCLPTISFKSEDNKSLGIWAQDDKGFFLIYDNGKQSADFFISNDLSKNPDGYTVEEFIEYFFDQTIEQSLNLNDNTIKKEVISEAISQKSSKIVSFSCSDSNKFKPLIWTILYLVIALFLLKADIDIKFEYGLTIHFIFGFFWLPGIILHISYLIKNHDTILTIDSKEKTIEYEKNGRVIKFQRNEIYNCEINEARSGKAPWNSYRYLWIVLNDHRQVVITNFITDPETIIDLLNLNFKTDRRTIPFLPI